MLQWRPFQCATAATLLTLCLLALTSCCAVCSFYDMSLVEKEGLPPNTPHPDLQKIDVSSSASGAPFMILGDTEGYVHLVDKDFNAQRFKAFDKDVLLMEYLHVSPHADDNSRMTDRRSHSMLCQRISLDTIHCTCTCTHESTDAHVHDARTTL